MEAVLEVINALPVNLLDFLALIGELWSILTRDLLDGGGGLVHERLNMGLKILQLLLLLLRDTEADQFIEARLHEVIHARHQLVEHLEPACALGHTILSAHDQRVSLDRA